MPRFLTECYHTQPNAHRILKEYNMYKKEAEDQQRRVDKYTADAADEWDIKTQVCRFALGG
ncbi:hypothetical protein JB92DRAFT_2697428 [Gautieria morchelliformis]|nr:hypothetical protein JB92DRAFT_2697428 [Gautieria morchelliformis]